MIFEITGAETADQLIKQLVALRHAARRLAKRSKETAYARAAWERLQRETPTETGADSLIYIGEQELEIRSLEIEVGRYLFPLCDALDAKASRTQILDALNTNPADRDTEMVRKYGDRCHRFISVLDLENSASTRKDEWTTIEMRPLKWCHTMAFMREMQTNAQFDRVIHEGANEFFGGAFGEYRERPLIERLAGRVCDGHGALRHGQRPQFSGGWLRRVSGRLLGHETAQGTHRKGRALGLLRRHFVHGKLAQRVELAHAALADQPRAMQSARGLVHLFQNSALTLGH